MTKPKKQPAPKIAEPPEPYHVPALPKPSHPNSSKSLLQQLAESTPTPQDWETSPTKRSRPDTRGDEEMLDEQPFASM